MTRTANLWTPALEREFHSAVQELHGVTQIPSTPEGHAHAPSSTTPAGSHVLSLQDESQLADDLAFLCHCQDGVQYVSAVTVQEHDAGLVIVIASNETPSDEVVDGLKKTLDIVVEYGSAQRDRETFCQRLFDEVLRLNQARILGRIRPPGWQPPAHIANRAKQKPSLYSDVRHAMKILRTRASSLQGMEEISSRLEELRDCLRHFNHAWRPDSPYNGIDRIVHACVALANLGDRRSLEKHLESLGVAANTPESAVARQVDKLARYSLLCRGLLRMARQQEYNSLFKAVSVVALPAFPAILRRTTGQVAHHECHVHAEVQQVLHYEQNPHAPRPRAIGCSKSACYLCDMFIAQHGDYVITHAHRRLYNKWTLPDATWMDRAQVQRYRGVLRAMVRLLQGQIQMCRRPGQVPGPYPNESVAVLRTFLSDSTLSRGSSVGRESVVRSSLGEARSSSRGSNSTLSTIVELQELPLEQELKFGQGPVEVEVGRSVFSFESLNKQSAVLSVARLAKPAGGLARSVDVDDIPTDDEMRVACSGSSSEVNFDVRVDEGLFVHVTVRWVEAEGSVE